MINTLSNIPQIYVEKSRDYQIFLKLLNVCVNSSKLDIDNIINAYDLFKCNDRLLDFLLSFTSFNINQLFSDLDLRFLISNFNYIIKNKGTILAVDQLMALILKTRDINVNYSIIYENKSIEDIANENSNWSNSYYIKIILDQELNINYLLDLIDYVKPVGYYIEIETAQFITSTSEITNYYEVTNFTRPNILSSTDEVLYSGDNLVSQISEDVYNGDITDSTRRYQQIDARSIITEDKLEADKNYPVIDYPDQVVKNNYNLATIHNSNSLNIIINNINQDEVEIEVVLNKLAISQNIVNNYKINWNDVSYIYNNGTKVLSNKVIIVKQNTNITLPIVVSILYKTITKESNKTVISEWKELQITTNVVVSKKEI